MNFSTEIDGQPPVTAREVVQWFCKTQGTSRRRPIPNEDQCKNIVRFMNRRLNPINLSDLELKEFDRKIKINNRFNELIKMAAEEVRALQKTISMIENMISNNFRDYEVGEPEYKEIIIPVKDLSKSVHEFSRKFSYTKKRKRVGFARATLQYILMAEILEAFEDCGRHASATTDSGPAVQVLAQALNRITGENYKPATLARSLRENRDIISEAQRRIKERKATRAARIGSIQTAKLCADS